MLETENLERGKLSIGMPSNIGSFYLFDKIIEFHNNYPNIEVTIITGSTNNLLSLLDSHKVDFVIDTSPINNISSDTIVTELESVNYCFVSKNKYDDIKSLKDLENKPLILPIPGTKNRYDLDELLSKNDVNIENVINIHTSEMIISGVKKNLGIGYVIYNLVEDDIKSGELNLVNIKEKLPTSVINIVYDKNFLTSAPKKFIKDYIDYELDL